MRSAAPLQCCMPSKGAVSKRQLNSLASLDAQAAALSALALCASCSRGPSLLKAGRQAAALQLLSSAPGSVSCRCMREACSARLSGATMLSTANTVKHPASSRCSLSCIATNVVQVVEWVLAGVRSEWQSPAFQAALDSPSAFVRHYMGLSITAGVPEVSITAAVSHQPEQAWHSALGHLTSSVCCAMQLMTFLLSCGRDVSIPSDLPCRLTIHSQHCPCTSCSASYLSSGWVS